MESTLLKVEKLQVSFHLREGVLKAVDGVEFTAKKGCVLGIVGESGCGKSMTAKAILRLVPAPGKVTGRALLNVEGSFVDLIPMEPTGREIRNIRGKRISMVFQEPMNSLSPIHTIGFQISEALLLHSPLSKTEAWAKAVELLHAVGIANPGQRAHEYPHQLSGGMRQRVMIAMAISCNPELLIADEPTTALDVSVQAQILNLLKQLQHRNNMAIIFITHNLGVVAQMADELVVMYLGQVMEQGPVRRIFHNPHHPYTVKLLQCIPDWKRESKTQLEIIKGVVPHPINLPKICAFYDRCPQAKEGLCDQGAPSLVEIDEGHFVRCFLSKANSAIDKE